MGLKATHLLIFLLTCREKSLLSTNYYFKIVYTLEGVEFAFSPRFRNFFSVRILKKDVRFGFPVNYLVRPYIISYLFQYLRLIFVYFLEYNLMYRF